MDPISNELKKNGINVLFSIDTISINDISTYVARALYSKFPELRLNYSTLFQSISRLKMYIADMPAGMANASYFYKNASIYFKKGLNMDEIKKLAIHECIHHFQEIKDSKGNLHRLGLCSYLGTRAYGNALNEAAVQLMAAFASDERRDLVTYYGITLPTDSPSYYPLLCNLIKQIGYITGYSVLFESTFYSNDAFFDKLKKTYGEAQSLKMQSNFEKILSYEERISKLNYKIQTKDLQYYTFKKTTDAIARYKEGIQKTFIDTQNMIVTGYFDEKIKELTSIKQIEEYRRQLYSFSALIGRTSKYTFFNDYYIKQMSKLDEIYERITGNVNLVVVKKSKIMMILQSLKKLFAGNASEYKSENENGLYK